MSEKSSEMREIVSAVAGTRGWNETREAWLSRAARKAGVTYRTVRAVFYGEITDPEHKAVRRLQSAAGRQAKQEASNLAAQYETIAGGLNASDADFYSEDVAALLHAARALRGLARPRDNEP